MNAENKNSDNEIKIEKYIKKSKIYYRQYKKIKK